MFIITADDTIIELEQTRFYADAFTDEALSLSWSKPQHPVANGFTKSDGIFRNPSQLTLSGCVAGQSLNKQGIDIFEGAESRTVAACNFIEAMGNARDYVTIDTGNGKVHTDMVLVAAPIRFQVGGVMAFDLIFEELQTFAISETFDASLGAEVNIGEVTTTAGEPDNIPTFPPYTPEPSSQARADYAQDQPQVFSRCHVECGTGVFCLDACYENAYLEAGL